MTAPRGAGHSALAPWRWRDGASGLLLGALLSLAVWRLQTPLLQGWQAVLGFWGAHLGQAWSAPDAGGTPLPSPWLLGSTSLVVLGIHVWAGRWPEPWWPARVLVRGLCLVQASACLFLLWMPARFPYGLAQHLKVLLQLGADFMVTLPLLLGLGWGVLRLPWTLKLGGPLLVLLYFALWLPHQAVLHAWLVSQGTALFMPVLFLCGGLLLNGWLFVALYAWLASLTPRVPPVGVQT